MKRIIIGLLALSSISALAVSKESCGFIRDLKTENDNSIVTFVVGHEYIVEGAASAAMLTEAKLQQKLICLTGVRPGTETSDGVIRDIATGVRLDSKDQTISDWKYTVKKETEIVQIEQVSKNEIQVTSCILEIYNTTNGTVCSARGMGFKHRALFDKNLNGYIVKGHANPAAGVTQPDYLFSFSPDNNFEGAIFVNPTHAVKDENGNLVLGEIKTHILARTK